MNDLFDPQSRQPVTISFSKLVFGVAFGILLHYVILILIGLAVGFSTGVIQDWQGQRLIEKQRTESRLELLRRQNEEAERQIKELDEQLRSSRRNAPSQ